MRSSVNTALANSSGRQDFGEPTNTVAVASLPMAVVPDDELQSSFPQVGDLFLDFRLVGELGRGSFGRVFLARQSDLAQRLVALKITDELFAESQTLAQLQHTNIVPIYSAHRTSQYQALCMPYFGATTLADICRAMAAHGSVPTSGQHIVSTLECKRGSTKGGATGSGFAVDGDSWASKDQTSGRLLATMSTARTNLEQLSRSTYVDAVLWLGARLADGLAHAHERGIVHRDLKPANVLLADDGRPMLLDFNLSTEMHRRGSTRGGTIPYMAPEQLSAFQDGKVDGVDGRADIYALGLILYELLAGRPAFQRRQLPREEMFAQMLADRRVSPPPLSKFNPAVTPATNAIVQKCLAFAPESRYASAPELLEDLERQQAHLPLKHISEPSTKERLRKWSQRHPRASSLSVLGTLAVVAMLALGAGLMQFRAAATRRHAQLELAEALKQTDQLRNELIRSPEGAAQHKAITAARQQLARYDLPGNTDFSKHPVVAALPADDVARWRERFGEIAALTIQAELDLLGPKPAKHDAGDLLQLSDAAAALGGRSHSWWKQRETICTLLGDEVGAVSASVAAGKVPPETVFDRYMVAFVAYHAGRFADAQKSLTSLTHDAPQYYGAWLLLGACQYRLLHDEDAVASFNVCVVLNPQNPRAFINRGYSLYRLNRMPLAASDFQKATSLGDTSPDVTFQLAKCLVNLKKYEDAEDLLTTLIDADRAALRAYYVRSELRQRRGDQAGAAADREALTKIEPVSAADFNARGLARLKTNVKGALADFQHAEQLDHRCFDALQNQADVFADRMNKSAEAVAALDRLIARAPDLPGPLAGRAVYLARLGRIDDALRDARAVLAMSSQAMNRYQVAGVYALTADRPGHRQEAMRLLASAIREQGSLADLLATDPELRPLHDTQEFQRLLDATRALRSFD